MIKYTYNKSVAFEEGGIESYDYKSSLSGDVYHSERSCYIEALKDSALKNLEIKDLEPEQSFYENDTPIRE